MVFLLSGILKAFNPSTVAHELVLIDFPKWTVYFVPILLPALEVLLSLIILFKPTRFIGMWCSLIALVLLTNYLVWRDVMGIDVPCPCFGNLVPEKYNTNIAGIIRNSFMVILNTFWILRKFR
jgi:hypothetical protein